MFCGAACCNTKDTEEASAEKMEVVMMDETSPTTPAAATKLTSEPKEKDQSVKFEDTDGPIKEAEKPVKEEATTKEEVIVEVPAEAPAQETSPAAETAAEAAPAAAPAEAVTEPASEPAPAPAAEEPAPVAVEEPAAAPAPAAAEPAPTGDMVEFEFTAKKTEVAEGLGLRILPDRRNLVVSSVLEGGCIHRWNTSDEAKAASKVVLYGTVLYSVNGVTGPLQDMLKAASEATELNIKARRYNKYSITVNKSGRLLGLELKEGTNIVSHVSEPCTTKGKMVLETYNTTCEEGKEILTDDLVTAVNGTTGDAATLIKALQVASGDTVISFTRA